jgi:hypothetical protein
MRDQNATYLLAKVMDWHDQGVVGNHVPRLQLVADYKYDHYQRFAPGKRFIESLALWLNQFDPVDRPQALDFVEEQLVFFSDKELSHLVELCYPDVIVQERMRIVAEENDIAVHKVAAIVSHPRFRELQFKSLYLGLSDGARTNELRRASAGEIGNEQIWQAYELGEAKSEDMLAELRSSLGENKNEIKNEDIWRTFEEHGVETANALIDTIRKTAKKPKNNARFNLIWLLDDFSGSGNTYIRYDNETGRYKGKISKIYEQLLRGGLIDTTHYEVFLLLYVATRQAVDHIEYWAERFTSEYGYKPLQLRVLCIIEPNVSVNYKSNPQLQSLIYNQKYYDHRSFDKHMAVGGTNNAQLGFAACALPVVLAHNTPNNSIYILWGPEQYNFSGLFPRISRHKVF